MKSKKLFVFLTLLCFLMQAGCERQIMEVATGKVTKVLSTTVYINGQLHSAGEGIKKYGHCISVSPDPTITDIRTEFCSTIGTGEFTSVLYNLEAGTKYYARGYITSGNELVYGNEITFVTEELQSSTNLQFHDY